ncbi:MAG: GWxTD domain-containing protein [Candidatus Cloacimonadaceae bacterium]
METILYRLKSASFKALLLVLTLSCLWLNAFAAEHLGIFVDAKRYFDYNKNTKYVIDYQIPYKNLMFLKRENGYFAEMQVKIFIAYPDSENFILLKEFTDNIGVSQKYDITSTGKSYLDRISLTLAKSGYRLKLQFQDLNSGLAYEWIYNAVNLNSDDILSDLEIVTANLPDSTIYAQKFKRNGKTALPDVSGIIAKGLIDSVYIFGEAYFPKEGKLKLTVMKDSSEVLIQSKELKPSNTIVPYTFPLNIANLSAGKYIAAVNASDGTQEQSRQLMFLLTEQAENLYYVFLDEDEEYELLSKLVSAKSPSNWKSMSKEAKRRYTSSMWTYLAMQQNMPVDQVVAEYKQRIDYCNKHFSHFEKGWKTDMGRIYIRNGRPDDIESDTSSDYGRLGRKDYQIWKYTGRLHSVYLFIDIPMNGNYKLMYVDNDDLESTNPNWRKYLGSDFDESKLEN